MPEVQAYPDRFIASAHNHRITKVTTAYFGNAKVPIDKEIAEYNSFNITKPLVIPPGKSVHVSLALYKRDGKREIEIEGHTRPY